MRKFRNIISSIYEYIKFKPTYYYENSFGEVKERFNFRIIFNIFFLLILSIISIIGINYIGLNSESIINLLNNRQEPFLIITAMAFWGFLWISSLYYSIRLTTGSVLFSILIELSIILSSFVLYKISVIIIYMLILLFSIERIIKFIIRKLGKNEIYKEKNNISK